MKINNYAHYTQCLLHDPCDRSRDGSHVSYPEGTNGYRWGLCRECDLCCICNRLVDMRNEGRQNGLDAAREAVAGLRSAIYNTATGPAVWREDTLAAIDALREKP